MSHSNKSWTWNHDSVWIWKMIVHETGEVHKSSHLQMFFRIGVLKKIMIFTGKPQCWNLFLIKMQAYNFLKKRLQCRCFPVDITKCFRTAFFVEHLWWLLLINQFKIFWEITASKFPGQHAAQFIFCRYESLCSATKTEIHLGCL